MTFDDDRPARPARPVRPVEVPNRRSPLAVAAIALTILAVIVLILANVWTEVVWYRQLGFQSVWTTEWIARISLHVGFGLIAGAAVWLSLWVAKRARPRQTTAPRSSLDQYREQVEPLEKVIMVALPLLVGLIAGGAMASHWVEILAWWNRESFGVEDPQFGLDASFYVFTLPVLRLFVGFWIAIALVCLVLSAFVHLLYGGLTTGGRNFITSGAARVQIAILGALVMIGIGANYWLDRFGLLTKQGEKFYGASYTDVNALLPARGILAGIAILVAILFLVVIWRGDWRIPATGIAMMVLSAIVIGGLYPAIVQRFQVEPNAQELEAEFIQRNIDATLFAYGLDDVKTTPYNAQVEALPGALRSDADTTTQVRLLDPTIVAPTFQQLQQNKQYYNFGDELSVDRYRVGDEIRDTVIAVRELDLSGLSDANRSWVNDTTVFTHGFGVVAAYGNKATSDGQPSFFEGGIPSTGELGDYEPRIYFGTTLPDYSIVGAPEGTTPWELDYPNDDAPNGQVNTTYKGDGGPGIGNLFARLMFAIKFGEEQILFSDRVTPESQVLYYRDPLERVAKVAPYLELDQTSYPAVVDGRVVWIVDAYTTSSDYPYSGVVNASGVFAGNENSATPTALNYLRNSVKATVDAYDGTVTLYAWDETDPILKTWRNVFPDAFTPASEISSDLMSHLRYPQDLFAIQRFQLATYHVTDAASFYSGQDFWRNPADPTKTDDTLQPPYYLTLKMPGQEEPAFSLTSSFIPGGNTDRNVLTGFLAVNSEPGNVAGEPDEDYGQLRLLELPRDSTVPGPGQVQNQFDTDPEAQNILNLLRQGSTEVINGNLLTLPVGGGLLYVQPVYVRSSEGTQFPLLRKVFVAFGDEVGFADTLPLALDQVFGDDGIEGDPTTVPDPETDPETDPGTGENPDVPDEVVTEARADLSAALQRASDAITEGQEALATGDFAAYGAAQAKLGAALDDAIEAEARLEGEPVVPNDPQPSAAPSPAASPEPEAEPDAEPANPDAPSL